MCAVHVTVGRAARLFVEGFEDKTYLHTCVKGFYVKDIPVTEVTQIFAIFPTNEGVTLSEGVAKEFPANRL